MMSMMEHFFMESALGTLTLVHTDVLSGLYMPDHLRGPGLEALGLARASGFETVSTITRIFQRKRTQFTPPHRCNWHGIPAAHLGPVESHSLRGDAHLRPTCRTRSGNRRGSGPWV